MLVPGRGPTRLSLCLRKALGGRHLWVGQAGVRTFYFVRACAPDGRAAPGGPDTEVKGAAACAHAWQGGRVLGSAKSWQRRHGLCWGLSCKLVLPDMAKLMADSEATFKAKCEAYSMHL